MATVNNKFRAKYGIESAAQIDILAGGLKVTAGGIDLNGSGTLTGIGSTTLVTNLNADKLDGSDASAFQAADATLTALAGLATGADVYPYFTAADTVAAGTITSFGRSLIDDANASAAQTTLGLVPGTNVQAYDATLAAVAGVTTAADALIYFTAADTATTTTLTSFGRSLIDDATNSDARTTLGLGTIATQAASSVAITGGNIDGTPIGVTTKSTGAFTSLTTTTTATIGSDLTVTGNLTVNGDTIQLNVTTLNVEDNEVILNSNVSGTPSVDGLLTVNRGSSTDVSIKWDETLDKWRFTNDGSTWYDMGGVGAGGTVGVADGGTGATTFTAGYLKASGTTAFTTVSSIPGADVSGNISGNAAGLSSTLGIGSGGTGQTTKANAYNALTPITTLGDLVYGSGTNTATRLAGNTTTTKQFLSQTGDGGNSAAPAWSTVSKSDVGLGSVDNVSINSWAGSTNIVTVGTIATGTWSAGTIAVNKGGTGLSSTPAQGQLLIGNNSNGYTLATLTDGTAINITEGNGTITIANSGVTSLSGTTNQVNVSASTGSITLSAPQDIHTSASPTFAGLSFVNSNDSSATVTVTANGTATTIDQFAVATYTSGEYLIQMKQGTKITTTKFIVLYDGSDVQITEYSYLNATAGAANATVSATYSGGNILVQATSPDAASTNVVCKAQRTLIKA